MSRQASTSPDSLDRLWAMLADLKMPGALEAVDGILSDADGGYVYFWADGVYFSPRLDHDKQCMCVIIGADELGRKELPAIADGYRESAQSWREVLLDLKSDMQFHYPVVVTQSYKQPLGSNSRSHDHHQKTR